MRRALWPRAQPGELAAETREYLPESARRAVRVAARDDGTLGGFIELSLRDVAEGCASSPVGYVEGWFVDPDLRRGGVGRRLVEAGEIWARSRGCTELGSDTELGNRDSERAHLRLGFEVTERLVTFRKPL